ncbi:MAG: type IV pilin N-terminal domain-containing protein [Candidatus Thermoplasmatota archaeon]|nr:type IV pilin N-terminal domain-containing protein [Candidatus Thermoplasmatota archaeon]
MKTASVKILKAEKYSFLLKEIRREEAVSEVVGTILILAITVVLFAAIFFYVQQFPLANPTQQVAVYPEISYNPDSRILYENITLKAGSILPRSDTYLIVVINNREFSTPATNLKVQSPYSNSSIYLEPGDVLMWNSSSIGINIPENSSVTSFLFYKPSSQVLWQSKYITTGELSISSFYATPDPLKPDASFEIVLEVETFDPNGTSANLNLTTLYGYNLSVSMNLYSTSGNFVTFYFYGNSPHVLSDNSTAYVTVHSNGMLVHSVIILT